MEENNDGLEIDEVYFAIVGGDIERCSYDRDVFDFECIRIGDKLYFENMEIMQEVVEVVDVVSENRINKNY